VYSVVLVADQAVHARLDAQALGREKELEVAHVVPEGGLAALSAHLSPERLAEAAVAVFIPAEPVAPRLRWDAGQGGRPPLVVHDIEGRVDVLSAVALGARGYVGFAEPEALADRILRVANKQPALPPEAEEACRLCLREVRRTDLRLEKVTAQEIAMLKMWAEDHAIKEIATAFKVAERTVTNRFQSLCAKLKVKHKALALPILLEAGLVRFE
jgi:DNA-binding NarL/FixJ family response regulator